jgi:hypothetical protein
MSISTAYFLAFLVLCFIAGLLLPLFVLQLAQPRGIAAI